MKNKIKKLVVPTQGNRIFEVGVNEVTKIEDNSSEFESSYWSLYDVYSKSKKGEYLSSQIDNCPVIIDFFEPNP
jgi:hypothetical protein